MKNSPLKFPSCAFSGCPEPSCVSVPWTTPWRRSWAVSRGPECHFSRKSWAMPPKSTGPSRKNPTGWRRRRRPSVARFPLDDCLKSLIWLVAVLSPWGGRASWSAGELSENRGLWRHKAEVCSQLLLFVGWGAQFSGFDTDLLVRVGRSYYVYIYLRCLNAFVFWKKNQMLNRHLL